MTILAGAPERHINDPKPPHWMLLALEGRAPLEFGAAMAARPLLQRTARGDGHPVLVFPGLATSDFYTIFLRNFLTERGYASHAWEQGFNFGPRPGVVERCEASLRRLHREYGQTVSLVGWSLGGVYARELAKLAPELVRCVITLGTPFAATPKATNAWRLYEILSGQSIEQDARAANLSEAPPVPTTSIYSRTDGIVAWQCSVQPSSPIAENIEVPASHVGMGLNPAALYAVADRLAQPEGQWQRFNPEGWGGLKKLLFKTH